MENDNRQYRYSLEHCCGNKKKLICPACGRRTFVPYIDSESGQLINETVGRCDREINCGYHKSPREFFEETNAQPQKRYWFPRQSPSSKREAYSFSTISHELVEASMQNLVQNNLLIYLREHYPMAKVIEAINRYKIGTSKLWPGATVFWQIDNNLHVRTGKIMLYDYHSGHRVKDPESKIMWVHRLKMFQDFRLSQCMFGAHVLDYSDKTVAIVESEKTAIIASMFFPEADWIATGGICNLRKEHCAPLKGKKVILFPDLGAEEKWARAAQSISELDGCTISTFLQRTANETDRKNGLDLADWLEEQNPNQSLNLKDFL